MRISTNMLYDLGAARMGDLHSALARTTEQIASGRRILVPSDDPIASSQVLELSQARAINEQFGVNRNGARHSLNMLEQGLQTLTSLIQDVQTLTVAAGNGAFDDQQRQHIATELRGRLDDMLGIANSRDGSGNFLFSGFQTATPSFGRSQGVVTYQGDQGQRMLQVAALRHVAVSNTGNEVFEGFKNGNGLFNVVAGAGNTGGGVFHLGPSSTGTPITSTYEVQFVSDDQFIVVDPNSSDPPVVQQFAPGELIQVGSASITIEGVPRAGDTFTVEPVRSQSIFNTLDALIGALERPAGTETGRAALNNGLGTASRELASALDNVLKVRASVGARLSELDALDAQGSDRELQLAQTVAQLQELDYVQAISELSKKKVILEAAQQSYLKTTGLSLFRYIS